MIKIIRKLFAYDEWAITRIVASLKSMSSQNQKALRSLAHLLIAEKVWFLRLQGQNTSEINLSPELSLTECESLANENQRAYADFLGSLNEEGLYSMVTYKNSKGTEFSTPVVDILTHVGLHGTYHRGQIATALRGEGVTPANTDFITFVREIDIS
jgi:uncharacterized damage-inducible protein DinB